MYKIMDGNEACSFVSYKFTELAGIYPITPASPMAEIVDKDSLDKKNFFEWHTFLHKTSTLIKYTWLTIFAKKLPDSSCFFAISSL